MDRANHYEAAFEAYLRDQRLPYVAVDESRRTSLDDESIKSLDFIVYGRGDAKLLIDVKGRKYPGGTARRPTYSWQNWSTEEDVDGLIRWEQQFGEGYTALLVFVYHLSPAIELTPGTRDLWHWRGRRYLMRAVAIKDYHKAMRKRSRKWGTVYLPGPSFREIVQPFRDFSHPEMLVIF